MRGYTDLKQAALIIDPSERETQAAKIVNEVYGPDTIAENNAQFGFRRFLIENLNVKVTASSKRPERRPAYELRRDCQGVKHYSHKRFGLFSKAWIHQEAGCIDVT
ncbi:hypothetical protein ABEB36_000336 [Hypothenemus hampei]|uniref:Uncharacterized protein n=1 Tax=Hypothenemus hampei TaxID=57062 RepID=A0ABD1FAY0_HYPHA